VDEETKDLGPTDEGDVGGGLLGKGEAPGEYFNVTPALAANKWGGAKPGPLTQNYAQGNAQGSGGPPTAAMNHGMNHGMKLGEPTLEPVNFNSPPIAKPGSPKNRPRTKR